MALINGLTNFMKKEGDFLDESKMKYGEELELK
jgi:hypothetical protein